MSREVGFAFESVHRCSGVLAVILIGIVFTSCATQPKVGAGSSSPALLRYKVEAMDGDRRIKSPLPGIEEIRVQSRAAESLSRGQAMVENQYHYLLDLFRPVKDSYFNTSRWSDSCLKRNQLDLPAHLPQQTGTGYRFRSQLSATTKLEVGQCASDSIDVVHIVEFCRIPSRLIEVTVTGPKMQSADFECPDQLVLR